MHLLPKALALTALAATPAAAQDAMLTFSCDLNGMAVPMAMAVQYVSDTGIAADPRGNISGVFPTGVIVYTAGEVVGPQVRYVFSGQNDFADFTEYPSMNRFRVRWVLDSPRNGVWMVVNPFGPGPSQHFCALNGIQPG